MSYGTFCLTSVPNTEPRREKHNQTLVPGQLKYSWENVLSLNICDTGKKSHKKPESSAERREQLGMSGGRSRRLLLDSHRCCSCQVRITSRQAWKEHNSPYSKLLNAKRKLRGKKRPTVPWDMNTEGLQCLSEATQKASSRTKSWVSWVTAKYSNHSIFCPWTKGKQ